MIRLEALLERLRNTGLLLEEQGGFDTTISVDHLANDSQKVGPNGMFVAVRGGVADGHLFIDKAVKYGAIAIVCEVMPEDLIREHPGITFARVANTRAAVAELAAAYYGDPSLELEMVGITGTNGKTTTGFLIHELLSRLGRKAGLLGTVETRIGTERYPASLTTPDSLDVHRVLREMVLAGCRACVMEVSSHALEQHRTRAVQFDVGIFTNLTQDHLDYHGSLEAYRLAKKKLFDQLGSESTALYNADDASGAGMVADTAARKVSFGRSAGADLRAEVLQNSLEGLRLRIDGTEQAYRLVGLFNAYNIAAAYGAGLALGFPPGDVADALAAAPPVPGRFEQFRFGDGRTVIVDYAHTPDALENVLRTVRETTEAGTVVWCVFGCGGNRDREKRPLMGAIAEQWADHLIVTSDNPRTEDPESILEDILAGMERPKQALRIVDRREAIRQAAERSGPGHVVLVAGKGHETYQDLGGERRIHFDDREEVLEQFG